MVKKQYALPKVATLPPSEVDVQELLYRFEEAVFQGDSCSFATLRSKWLELNFSFVFEARPLCLTRDDFIQSLFASALDCLQVPLRPRRCRQATPEPETPAAHEELHEQVSGERANSARTLSISALVESDDEDDELHYQQHMYARSLLAKCPWEAPGGFASGRDLGRREGRPVESGHVHHSQNLPEASGALGEKVQELSLEALDMLPDLNEFNEGIDDDLDELQNNYAFRNAMRETARSAWGRREAAQPPDHPTEPQVFLATRQPVPEVVRIGSIFLLYALYSAQPGLPIVRIYVPITLLRGLAWMTGRSRDADACLRKLVADDAFVIGAVRRPISGTPIAREAGRPIRCIMEPDKDEQKALMRQSLRHIRTSAGKWNALQHVQLLCNSYKAAQIRLWGSKEQMPQGLCDFSTGDKLHELVQEMQAKVKKLLPEVRFSRFLGIPKEGEEEEREAGQPLDNAAQARLQEEIAAERAKAAKAEAEAAATRRAMRMAQEDEDEMPTLDELGLNMPGARRHANSDSEDSQLGVLPKAARMVELQRADEEMEFRQSMYKWRTAFQNISRQQAAPRSSEPHRTEPNISKARPAVVDECPETDETASGRKIPATKAQAPPKSAARQKSTANRQVSKQSRPEASNAAGNGQKRSRQNAQTLEQSAALSKEAPGGQSSLQAATESAVSGTLSPPRNRQTPPRESSRARKRGQRRSRVLPCDVGVSQGSKGLGDCGSIVNTAEDVEALRASRPAGPLSKPGSEDPRHRPESAARLRSPSGRPCDQAGLDESKRIPNTKPKLARGLELTGMPPLEMPGLSSAMPRIARTLPRSFNSKQTAALQALMDADAEAARLLEEL